MTVHDERLFVFDPLLEEGRPLIGVPELLLHSVDFNPSLLDVVAVINRVCVSSNLLHVLSVFEEVSWVWVVSVADLMEGQHLLVTPAREVTCYIRNLVLEIFIRQVPCSETDFSMLLLYLIDLIPDRVSCITSQHG
jgi:hypothetical protein